MNRRDALFTGLAAAFGMPLATSKENKNMVATVPAAPRCKAPEPTNNCPLTPCHPKNDARVERLTVLVHAVREDSWRLAEEHVDGCNCDHCHTVDGISWVLEVLESCLDSDLVGWTYFFDIAPGEAADIADAARRLDLPVEMVREFVEWRSPKSRKAKKLVEDCAAAG